MAKETSSDTVKRIVLTALIVGWIGWVSNAIITSQNQISEAKVERTHIYKSIDEIKHGIQSITEYFMIPKPSKK